MLNASATKRKQRAVQNVLANNDYYVREIQSNFHIAGKYKTKIHIDDSSGKRRILEVPPYYPDQIIQHALVDVTYPYIRKKFIDQTCCSIIGRGTLYASKLVREFIRRGARYFVKFDIRKYFPNVDHDILKRQLGRIFKDAKIIELYEEIIDSTEHGIPIGNYTSQSLANLYLTPLDRYVKEQLHIEFYVRYMDDFIIMGRNRRKLESSIAPIKNYIKTQLKLKTHDDERVLAISHIGKDGKRHGAPIDFCGFRHYSDHTTIRRRIYKRFRRCCIRQAKCPSVHRSRRLMCYYGYLVHSNSEQISKKYTKAIHISSCLSKGGKAHG